VLKNFTGEGRGDPAGMVTGNVMAFVNDGLLERDVMLEAVLGIVEDVLLLVSGVEVIMRDHPGAGVIR
jgi:hypothetical protein